MITSFIIRYRDEGATPGEYETAASEHVGDSRKRLVVTLVNASRLQVVVSKAREHTVLVQAPCPFALPIQH